MTVRELIEFLKHAPADEEVFIDDEPLGEVEIAVGDDGVFLWSETMSKKGD